MGRTVKKSLTLAVALRWGELCGDCEGGCKEKPTPYSCVYLNTVKCTGCGGTGCPDCDNTGKLKLDDCPRKMVGDDARAALRLADFARRGCLPCVGGVVDQNDATMWAIQMIFDLESVYRRKANLSD